MADIQDLSTVQLRAKKQSALGTPASGGSGYALEVLPSQGLALQISTIESAMIRRSRMRKRPRHGPKSTTAAYETELSARGALDPFLEAVLGCTAQAAQNFANTDWGAVTITDTGVTATFASGTLWTDSIVAGMMIQFTNLSVGANNSVWVPIISVDSETVMTLASGYLADNASDAAWNAVIAKNFQTPTPYLDTYWTIEEVLSEIDISKIASDMRWNALNFDFQPNQYGKIGLGAGGRGVFSMPTGASSPSLTDPTSAEGSSLILTDGGIYLNGTKRTDLTAARFGISAPVSPIAVIASNLGPDVTLGQFSFAGELTGLVASATDFTAVDAETTISAFLHCKEKATSQKGLGIYCGYLSYGGYGAPAGGEGPQMASIPLYGGEDERGTGTTGYAPSTMVISVCT